MDPNQQQLLLTGGASKSPYIEDVFSTYLYKGNGAARTITTGLDVSSGGLVWMKCRQENYSHILYDTERGTGTSKMISSDQNYLQGHYSTIANLTSFNNNGFSLGTTSSTNIINENNKDFTSWSFLKQKGFFDVVTWTGNGATRQIPHSLGCVPGCIMVKNTSSAMDWAVWHKGATEFPEAATNTLCLNSTSGASTNNTYFDNGSTPPTKDNFTVHTSNRVNDTDETYVAYVFAGGSSTAANAKSVDLDGSGDYLSLPANSDLEMDGDFTVEGWVYVDVNAWNGTRQTFFANSIGWTTNHAGISLMNSGGADEQNMITVWSDTTRVLSSSPVTVKPSDGWTHIAVTRSGSTVRIFKNGMQAGSTATYSDTFHFGTGATWIGAITMSTGAAPEVLDGGISNLRVIKGTALYTEAFKVPTEPLTTTSQGATASEVKLLCCNDASVTGSTVTPGTITANGDPTAKSISPFDDPNGFIFGEEEDQGIIKCGKYRGNGLSGETAGPDIHCGWQPQWIWIKATGIGSEQWWLFDCMRGIVSQGNDYSLEMSRPQSEYEGNWDLIDLNATGFKIKTSDDKVNNTSNYVYCAIRGRDALVSKPAEAGTDRFAMDVGSGSNSIPPGTFDSGFPVDFALMREPAASSQWYTTARLQGFGYVRTNDVNVEAQGNPSFAKDSNVGWGQDAYGSNWMSWAWQRGAGFDTVCWRGNDTARAIPHSLTKTPEMMWIKNRSTESAWQCWHKGLNGGTGTQDYRIILNTSSPQTSGIGAALWNSKLPNSNYINIGPDGAVNGNNNNLVAYLFASVTGISKCGYYTGAGSSNKVISDVGFTPRLIIIKCATDSWGWATFDTTRGMTNSGNDPVLYLNDPGQQSSGNNYIPDISATGFTVAANHNLVNQLNETYIYYAHA
tara:strand:+ start:182 stop:2884 length:2703 start_codon:yes stop_codon:yes gene_type:complete